MKKLIGIKISDALKLEKINEVELLAGKEGLDRRITKVNIMEVPDIVDWVKEGELLFTTLYSIKDDKQALKKLIPNLVEKKLAGLGIKPGRYINEIPKFMIEQADKYNFPLLKLPYNFSFSEFINPILSEILNVQTKFLEKTLNIHEELTNTVLYEDGLDRLSYVLVDMINNPVMIVDSNMAFMSHFIPKKYNKEIDKEDLLQTLSLDRETKEEIYGYRCKKKNVFINNRGMDLIKIPIITPNSHFGYLFAWEYDNSINKLDLATLKWASTIAALDILNERSIVNVELKYKNELLYDILKGKINNKQTIVNRGQNMGIKLDRGFFVVVFELKDLISKHFKNEGILNENIQKKYLESAKRIIDDDIIMCDLGTYLIALYPEEEKDKNSVKEFSKKVLNLINKKDRDLVKVGTGNYKKDIMNLHESYSQAKRTINVASKLNEEDQIYFFEDLGVYKLLYKIDKEEKNSFLENSIIPLLKYDRAHNTELLKTLKTFFEENGNLTNVAKKIYIHYNTVHYRLKRIEKITGLSLENPDEKLNLEIALKILNFTDILGEKNA